MGENDPFILFFQEFPGLRRRVIELDLLQNMEEDLVEEIPGVMLRIGLNETTLTKALLRGHYVMAENIIEETTDIDFLNDGALAATPLNIVLTGPGGQYQQPRNLKLARLLLQKGANPNIRIPNHDLESASESPLELLIRYYLKLLEVFTVSSTGQFKQSYISGIETELMDTVGINGELGGLTPSVVVEHTRQLVHLCLECGGDPNLPTTDAARTIFHIALIAKVPDTQLIQKLLDLGANVNHADVHNTTPLMDLILQADQQTIAQEMKRLEDHGQVAQLDNQNCTLQSALFRAAHQGKTQTALHLIKLGAKPGLCARTQQDAAFRHPLINRSVYSGTPALLAPLLANSPCWWKLNDSPLSFKSDCPVAGAAKICKKESPLFQVEKAETIMRDYVAPMVDAGGMLVDSVAQSLFHLIRCLTQHKYIADSSKVDPVSAVCLMFGHSSAGLKQLAVRAILKQVLFQCRQPAEVMDTLKNNCIKHGYTPFLLSVEPSAANIHDNGSIVHEFMLEPDSELELSMRSAPSLRTTQEERDIDRLLEEMNSHLDRSLPFNDRLDALELASSTHRETELEHYDSSSCGTSPVQAIQQAANNSQTASNSQTTRNAQDSTNSQSLSNNQAAINCQASGNSVPATNIQASNCGQDITDSEIPPDCQAPSNSIASNYSQAASYSPVESNSQPTSNSQASFNYQDASCSQSITDCHVSPDHEAPSNSQVTNIDAHNHQIEAEGDAVHNDDKMMSKVEGLDHKDIESEASSPHINAFHQVVQENAKIYKYEEDETVSSVIKSFSDLAGLSYEDTILGKRLLIIQMLHNMDQTKLSSQDLELVNTHPHVNQQLQTLARKLDLIKAGASIPGDQLVTATPANNKICDISNHSSDRHSSPLNSTSDGNSIVIENEDIPCLSASGLEENFSHLEVSNLSSIPGQNSQQTADDGCMLKLSNCLIESTDYLIDYRNALINSITSAIMDTNLSSIDTVETNLSATNNSSNGTNCSNEPRMQLDENWSLGPIKNLEGSTSTTKTSSLAQNETASRSVQAINHSVEIVKSLQVNLTVDQHNQTAKVKEEGATLGDDAALPDYFENISACSPVLSEDNDQHFIPEPQLGDIFSRGPGVLSRLLGGSSEADDSSGPPSLVYGESESDTDSVCTENVAVLKHTCCRSVSGDNNVIDNTSVISYLSPQVVDALTQELGIPVSLRPFFCLEAARLQLAMVLSFNHAINCDRNCEGDDEEEDDDDDDENEDEHFDSDSDSNLGLYLPPRYVENRSAGLRSSSSSSSSTSISNISIGASVRSNFGSVPSTFDVGSVGSSNDSHQVLTGRFNPVISGQPVDIEDGEEGGHDDVAEDISGGVDVRSGVDDDSWESASSSSGWMPDVTASFASRSSGNWLEERRLARSSWLQEDPLRRFLCDSPEPHDWLYSTSSESEDS